MVSGEADLHVTSLQAPAITRWWLLTASQQLSAGSLPVCSTVKREDAESSDAYKRLGTSSGQS